MADDVYRMFDTASQSTVPLVRRPGGTVYIFTWTDEDKADYWELMNINGGKAAAGNISVKMGVSRRCLLT